MSSSYAFISWTYISTFTYHRLMFIRDSRRSYRIYSDSGVIRYKSYQIQDLSDTGVPVGTTGLIQRQNLIRDRT